MSRSSTWSKTASAISRSARAAGDIDEIGAQAADQEVAGEDDAHADQQRIQRGHRVVRDDAVIDDHREDRRGQREHVGQRGRQRRARSTAAARSAPAPRTSGRGGLARAALNTCDSARGWPHLASTDRRSERPHRPRLSSAARSVPAGRPRSGRFQGSDSNTQAGCWASPASEQQHRLVFAGTSAARRMATARAQAEAFHRLDEIARLPRRIGPRHGGTQRRRRHGAAVVGQQEQQAGLQRLQRGRRRRHSVRRSAGRQGLGRQGAWGAAWWLGRWQGGAWLRTSAGRLEHRGAQGAGGPEPGAAGCRRRLRQAHQRPERGGEVEHAPARQRRIDLGIQESLSGTLTVSCAFSTSSRLPRRLTNSSRTAPQRDDAL